MNLLTALTVLNCIFILLYFLLRRPSGMTYTEMIVARTLGSFILTLVALIVVSLLILREMHILLVIAWVVNILVAVGMILYFLMIVSKRT